MAAIYTCGHCGKPVSKDTHRCPHCGAILSYIKCKNCGFIGSESDFVGDICPKCHTVVQVTPSMPVAIQSPSPKKEKCPFCGTEIDDANAANCGNCGQPRTLILGARKLTSAARRFMIAGILNILTGLCIATVLGALIFTIPVGLFVVILGIWEVVNAYLFWYTPPKTAWNPKHLAFMEMAAFLAGPIWNLIFGIVNLTQLGDPNVAAYFDDLYKEDPLKQKRVTRRLTGWMLTGFGGVFAFLAVLILLISSAAQFSGENPSENIEGFFITMGICPIPMLVIGFIMVVGGIYVLISVKKLMGDKGPSLKQAGVDTIAIPTIAAKTESSQASNRSDLEATKTVLLLLASNVLPKWRDAVALHQASNIERARNLYLEIIKEYPRALSAYNNMAQTFLIQEDLKTAQEYIDKAVHVFYPCARINKGAILFMQGNKMGAIEAFKDGGNDQSFTNLCLVYAELGQYQDAIQAGEEAIKLNPKNPIAYANLEDVYLKLGFQEKAEITRKIALKNVDEKSIQRVLMTVRDTNLVMADAERQLIVQIGLDGSMISINGA